MSALQRVYAQVVVHPARIERLGYMLMRSAAYASEPSAQRRRRLGQTLLGMVTLSRREREAAAWAAWGGPQAKVRS